MVSATDPDGDGLPTTFEREKTLTSPTRADTDGDRLPDGSEDPDRDGLTNRQEYVAWLHPRRADTDGDGLRDPWEDRDRDGLSTIFEFRAGTHPRFADSDRDGIPDGNEDGDRDNLTNRGEVRARTSPSRPDTDGDGFLDGDEVRAGSDPRERGRSTPATAAADVPTLPEAPSCGIFPASNVWNRRIDGLPVRSDSATLIGTIGTTAKLHPDFGSYLGYGIPYNVVGAGQATTRVAFDYADESDDVPYPIPASPKVEGGSDSHILVVDRDACRLYELFAAHRETDGSWSAGSGATWDLRSNALRPAGWTSADAAGLPILPGLVRYDEVAAGEVRHAIRFTTDETRNAYLYPARHYASSLTANAVPADGPARPPQGELRRLVAPGAGPGDRGGDAALRPDPGRQRLAVVLPGRLRCPLGRRPAQRAEGDPRFGLRGRRHERPGQRPVAVRRPRVGSAYGSPCPRVKKTRLSHSGSPDQRLTRMPRISAEGHTAEIDPTFDQLEPP